MALAEDQIMARFDQFMQSSSHIVDRAVRLGYRRKFTSSSAQTKGDGAETKKRENVVVLSDSDKLEADPSSDEDFVVTTSNAKSPNLPRSSDEVQEITELSSKRPAVRQGLASPQLKKKTRPWMPPKKPIFKATPSKPKSMAELQRANPKLAANLLNEVNRQRQNVAAGSRMNRPAGTFAGQAARQGEAVASRPQSRPGQATQPKSPAYARNKAHKQEQVPREEKGPKPNWSAVRQALGADLFGPRKPVSRPAPSEKEPAKPKLRPKVSPKHGAAAATQMQQSRGEMKSLRDLIQRKRAAPSAAPNVEPVAQRVTPQDVSRRPQQPASTVTSAQRPVSPPAMPAAPPQASPNAQPATMQPRPEHSSCLQTTEQSSHGGDLCAQPSQASTPSQDLHESEEDGLRSTPIDVESQPQVRNEEAAEADQTDTRSVAEKLEWERRAAEIQRQALEAQRLKKRKRAEAEINERALARLEEHRSLQVSKQQEEHNRETMRVTIRTELSRILRAIPGAVPGKANVYQTLVALKLLPVQSNGQAEILKAFKRAKLQYHPDRHVSKTLYEQLRAEETFKVICEAGNRSRMQ